MDMKRSLSDIQGLIQKLPEAQRAALLKGVTAGVDENARTEVAELAGQIAALPEPVREAIVKELRSGEKVSR